LTPPDGALHFKPGSVGQFGYEKSSPQRLPVSKIEHKNTAMLFQ
jgi:hypothetical protein